MRLAQFVATPETRSALLAVRRVTAAVRAGRTSAEALPLYLHGPPGVGKSHLVNGLVAAASETAPPRTAQIIPASDLVSTDSPPDERQGALACDLLIVEDLQHLSTRSIDAFANLLEYRSSRRRACVVTASVGPARLSGLPNRLFSRLSAGLVVALDLPSPSTRLYLLERLAQRRRLTTAPGVLNWLADETSGGVRSVLGALTMLEAVSAEFPMPPSLEAVQAKWAVLAPPAELPSVERIKQRVAAYFGLNAREFESRKRHARTLWPLQVAMFLARELTKLPWTDLGDAFGGRDPSTMRHGVSKVAERIAADSNAATAVRLLRAELS